MLFISESQVCYIIVNMKKLFTIVSVLAMLMACGGNGTETDKEISADSLYQMSDSVLTDTLNVSDTIKIQYAKGLKVSYEGDSVHILISNPDPGAKRSKQEELVISISQAKHNRFICTTALQLGNFEVLGLENRIVGMNTLRNVFSPQIKKQMKSGTTVKIGKEGAFDLEAVIASQPDYIFVSASKHGGFDVLKDCGIPLISHHGYKETDPLGQAEWIKLIGLLTGEPRRANAVFNDIEKKYNKLKSEVQQLISSQVASENSSSTSSDSSSSVTLPAGEGRGGASPLPTVMSGRQIRDGWYIVGGRSYMAQLFKDAGVSYVMADNDDSGGVTLDFEAAYAKGVNADFWQTDGSHEGDFTLADLAAEDARYADLAAYKNGRVLFCNFSQVPYRELSPVHPHLILADFVKAFHPEILPHYTPKYYKIIK